MKNNESPDIDNVCENCGSEINDKNKALKQSVVEEVYEGIPRIRYVITKCQNCFS